MPREHGPERSLNDGDDAKAVLDRDAGAPLDIN
jgi:hypothetical protein